MDITSLRWYMPDRPDTVKGALLVAGVALTVSATQELQSGDIVRGFICLVAGLAVFAFGERVHRSRWLA